MCDHNASRASLRVFLASTDRHAFQDFTEGEYPLLLGNCRGCSSTLAVEVDLARGHVVRGEIADTAIGVVRAPTGDEWNDERIK